MRPKSDTRGVDTQYDPPLATAAENTLVPHSPIPWTWMPGEMDDEYAIDGAKLTDADGRSAFKVDCGDFSGLSNADAEFIVRAVNNHDALLAALKALSAEEHRDDGDPVLDAARKQAQAAIARAEGR